MLVVFGGLPGTGKSTIARAVASRIRAAYLRIDAIEQAIKDGGIASPIGATGYIVAHALAEANVTLGMAVIADCVNPVAESRDGWRSLAARLNTRIIEVEIVCSDLAEHRARVEGRSSDIPGLALPTWQSVLDRHYEPWTAPHLVIDTAHLGPEDAVAKIEGRLRPRL